MDRGYLLLECIIVLAVLMGLYTLFSSQYLSRLTFQTSSQLVLTTLKSAQLYSMATAQDVLLYTHQQDIEIVGEHSYRRVIRFDPRVDLHINRLQGLGMKPSLNSKYSGTLSMSSNDIKKSISFPVGLAILKLK